MNWRRIKIAFYIALIYWAPSTFVLLSMVYGRGLELFPPAVAAFLIRFFMPGYFIGFIFAFAASKILGIVGQLITLLLMTILMLPFTYFFKIKGRDKMSNALDIPN